MVSKRWISVSALILSLVLTVTTAGVALAQDNSDVATHPALSIKAPYSVGLGEPLPIVVTELSSGNPVQGAEVWAVQYPLLRSLAADIRSTNLPRGRYQFLGTIGADGQITPSPVLEGAGQFLIIATYSGYAPGLHTIVVKPEALAIQAPGVATVGELITIKVTESNNDVPVAGAEIYIKRHPIRRGIFTENLTQRQRILNQSRLQLRQTIKNTEISVKPVLLPKDEVNAVARGWVEEHEGSIGETDANGEIIVSFDRVGLYQIIAVKEGYLPGRARTKVQPEIPANILGIKGPSSADLGEEIIFTVIERSSGSVIAGAEVYAFNLALGWGTLDEDKLSRFRFELGSYGDMATEIETLIDEYGEELGTTDENGQVTAVFTTAGRYVIVATKDGYIPGISHIAVGVVKMPIPFKSGMVDNATPEFKLKRPVPLPVPDNGDNVTPKFRFFQWRLRPQPPPGTDNNSQPELNSKQVLPWSKSGMENGKKGLRFNLERFIPWLKPKVQNGGEPELNQTQLEDSLS